jgi:hypothetical protein
MFSSRQRFTLNVAGWMNWIWLSNECKGANNISNDVGRVKVLGVIFS